MGGGLNVLWTLVKVRSLQLEYARVLYESLLMPVLMECSETIWKEERSRLWLYR